MHEFRDSPPHTPSLISLRLTELTLRCTTCRPQRDDAVQLRIMSSNETILVRRQVVSVGILSGLLTSRVCCHWMNEIQDVWQIFHNSAIHSDLNRFQKTPHSAMLWRRNDLEEIV